ncbi:hypothetical protein NPIL_318381 [Nephila pilipes]|uniref:Uncharacterized protein n=1 Tax=Nephila pilipes TaxID=299642 RepID=A0A8X6Q6J8_NEPPI|nr:hypothetical protein NPIL_506361 [Nephila pilipes]GFU05120.1 hypothetical protein NPIL_318381 [Nephila pilipes]
MPRRGKSMSTRLPDMDNRSGDKTESKVRSLPSLSTLFAEGNKKYEWINTTIVYLRDSQNKKIKMRAILDRAAQPNFITTNVAKALG